MAGLSSPALRAYRHQTEHYDWLSGYLHARGMSTSARLMMAVISGMMALCLTALLFSADGPDGPVRVAMTWLAVAIGVGSTAMWLWRWPTRKQSFMFGLACNAAVALGVLAYPNPLASLIGCIAFATIGAYIAFLHSIAFMLYNLAVGTSVSLFLAAQVALTGHPVLALVDFLLVIQINIFMPLAIRALVNALSVDLVDSDRDPLTGLYNRRAFEHRTLGLLVARENADSYLTIALIDLDRFKALNDTQGHLAGDRALVRVAKALRVSAAKSAVVARSGGEEFLVAIVSSERDPDRVAQQMCDAIAALPARVTASVGTACALLDTNDDASHQALIQRLTAEADGAMYRAKRSGGNQVRHHDEAEDSAA